MGAEDFRQQRDIQHTNAVLGLKSATLWDLWLKYYSLGGQAGEADLAAYLRGDACLSGWESRILQVAMDELGEDEPAQPRAGIDPFAHGLMRGLGVDPYLPSRWGRD